jgi:hypothetical protein
MKLWEFVGDKVVMGEDGRCLGSVYSLELLEDYRGLEEERGKEEVLY